MFSVDTFDPTCLPEQIAAGISAKYSITVSAESKLYGLLVDYIADNAPNCRSYTANVMHPRKSTSLKGEIIQKPSRVKLTIGFGVFDFRDDAGKMHCAVHHTKGKPLGTCNGIEMFRELIVLTDNAEELASFFSQLIEASEATTKGTISIYHFNSKCRYWRSSSCIKARPLESVTLPTQTKLQVLSDLENFITDEMQAFYEKHGIPYRRSYLFYGVPGSGKTSFIQALAGHCNRSISYLQIDPEMTDVVLRSSMDTLPRETVVVIEDIDALFDRSRQSKTIKGPLTFSGLLNALDGVGCSTGQIFILTTNLRDQLDPALIRKGRVDLQVRFDYAEDEQIAQMWQSFYPEARDMSSDFVAAVRCALDGRCVTTAELQHFFVCEMRSAPSQALANAGMIAEELKAKEAEAQAAELAASIKAEGRETESSGIASNRASGENLAVASDGNKKRSAQKPDDDDDCGSTAAGSSTTAAATTVHRIHLHLHATEKVAVSVVKGPDSEESIANPHSGAGAEAGDQ